MKKKLFGLCIICILVGCIFLIQKNSPVVIGEKEVSIRQKHDVLKADEVLLPQKTAEYRVDIEAFLKSDNENKSSVITLLREFAREAEVSEEYMYVSKIPVYYWDADKNKADGSRCLLVFWEPTCTEMKICELSVGSKRQVLRVDYPINDYSDEIMAIQDRELICVLARNEKGEEQDMLIDSENSIITQNTGYHSFEMTVEGDYFGSIKELKDLMFSYEKLRERETLMKIEIY